MIGSRHRARHRIAAAGFFWGLSNATPLLTPATTPVATRPVRNWVRFPIWNSGQEPEKYCVLHVKTLMPADKQRNNLDCYSIKSLQTWNVRGLYGCEVAYELRSTIITCPILYGAIYDEIERKTSPINWPIGLSIYCLPDPIIDFLT